MSDTDEIKTRLAEATEKVDRLITGIPERHFQYINNPDAAAKRIDELEVQVAEHGDLKGQVDALNAKLDDALAGQRDRAQAGDDNRLLTDRDAVDGRGANLSPELARGGPFVDEQHHVGDLDATKGDGKKNDLQPNAEGSFVADHDTAGNREPSQPNG